MAENIGLDFAALHGPQAADRAAASARASRATSSRRTRSRSSRARAASRARARSSSKGEEGETQARRRRTSSSPPARGRAAFPASPPTARRSSPPTRSWSSRRCPKSLVVIGAGAVGIEFASIFARFGVHGDRDRAAAARAAARGRGDLGRGAASCWRKHMTHPHRRQDRGARSRPRTASRSPSAPPPARPRRVTAEMLLVAVGRGPVTDGLGLESTKVQLEKGYVKVNDAHGDRRAGRLRHRRRGDDRGKPHPQLAHVASAEGIGVAERLAGKNDRAAQLRPRPVRHLLPARGGGRRPDRGRGEEARLRREGRQVPLRQPGQAAHHRPRRRAS